MCSRKSSLISSGSSHDRRSAHCRGQCPQRRAPLRAPTAGIESDRKRGFHFARSLGERKRGSSVYGDITRVGVAAENPTAKQQEIFQIVRSAQKAAIELVKSRFAQKKRLEGWEVDEAARRVIRDAGYGEFFIHRTGHNIEVHLHGSGANMDNLESHDARAILRGTCFSIEPGIYLPGEFGVRLETDLYIHLDGTVEVTGGEQDEVVFLGTGMC